MDTWGSWLRRNLEQHHSEYLLVAIVIFGATMTMHLAHDSSRDKDLVQFGREMTTGALACLYGFMRGRSESAMSRTVVSTPPPATVITTTTEPK